MEDILKKNIERELSNLIHLEINYNLVELEMIKNIEVKQNNVSIILLVPFLEISIKVEFIILIKKSLKNKNIKVKINLAVMNEKDKEKFMKMVREEWNI